MVYLLGIYVLFFLWTLPPFLEEVNEELYDAPVLVKYLAFIETSIIYFVVIPFAFIGTIFDLIINKYND